MAPLPSCRQHSATRAAPVLGSPPLSVSHSARLAAAPGFKLASSLSSDFPYSAPTGSMAPLPSCHRHSATRAAPVLGSPPLSVSRPPGSKLASNLSSGFPYSAPTGSMAIPYAGFQLPGSSNCSNSGRAASMVPPTFVPLFVCLRFGRWPSCSAKIAAFDFDRCLAKTSIRRFIIL